MLSFRFIVRFLKAFFARFNTLIIIGVFVGFLIFLTISILLPNLIITTQRVGIIGRFTLSSLPLEISSLISKGLTKVANNGSVEPDIAKSWQTSDGGKTWTFELDSSLKWHDGKSLISKDLTYEFSDAKIEFPSDNAIQFILDSKFSAFPLIVSKPAFKKGLLGLNDWKVKKLNLAGGYLQSLTIQDKGKNKIQFKFYPSEERAKIAFKLGEIDTIQNLQNPEPFNSWKQIDLGKNKSYDNVVVLFINTQKEKLSDKAVRLSLNYAIDKNLFNDERAISPISPLSWAYNPQVKEFNQDLNKTKEAKGMEIKISTLPNLTKTAEIISDNWSEVGIKSEIEVVTTIPQDYDVFLATLDIPKDPDQYSLWHSTQTSTNISKLNNPRIDKLLEDGRTELDQETRKKIYLDFQRFLVEEVPAIFLYHPTLYTISRK
jgi:peptide/nickel transport system substrate-binding protein